MTDDERRRAQKRARARRYRQRHPDRQRARWQKWISENRERRAAYMVAYATENREKLADYNKAYNEKHRKRIRLYRYGLTIEAYDAVVLAQGGRCAVCGRIPRYPLVPDHDHSCCSSEPTCGKCLRGLICVRCNAGIAYLGDDVEGVEHALEYLIAARRRRAVWIEGVA